MSSTQTSIARTLLGVAAVVSLFFSLGCASTPGSSEGVKIPLLSRSQDKALAKQVEADTFPTAKQAGL